MDLCDPVSIVLVTAGSRGQSLLFRYPFVAPCRTEQKEKGNLHGIYERVYSAKPVNTDNRPYADLGS